jgi:hypothetical protein
LDASPGQAQISQSRLHQGFLTAAKSTQASAINYTATISHFPALPKPATNDVGDVTVFSVSEASQASQDSTDTYSVSTSSEPAIAEEYVPVLHGQLDMTDNSVDGKVYFDPDRFSTWLYFHSHQPDSLPCSDRVSSLDSNAESYGMFSLYALLYTSNLCKLFIFGLILFYIISMFSFLVSNLILT